MEKSPIEQAIAIAGSEAKLAEAIGFTQAGINKAKNSGRAGPEMALAIHHFTNGIVSAASIRPDLWQSDGAVPTAPETIPAEPERTS